MDAEGKVRVVPGTPAQNMARPPVLPQGETAIARVWLQGPTDKLGDLNLYPIEPEPATKDVPVADRLLPKTLAKLRNGEKVTIVAWGDSHCRLRLAASRSTGTRILRRAVARALPAGRG